jgi:hypothetical protein
MVMSGCASTVRIRNAAEGASLPEPGGRPWRAGAGEPDWLWRCSSLIAQLSLTPKCQAAARQEWPASAEAMIRTRRSSE